MSGMKGYDKHKKLIATAIVVSLLLFLIVVMSSYFKAFIGALILYVLFRPVHERLSQRISRKKSAIVVMLLTIFIVLIPIVLISSVAINQISGLMSVRSDSMEQIGNIEDMVESFIPGIDISGFISRTIQSIGTYLRTALINAVSWAGEMLILLLIAYFILYYLLVYDKALPDKVKAYLPFSEKNTSKLISKFRDVTHSTIYSTGIIALIQGTLLAIGLAVLGVEMALLLGLIGAILSFLPMIGVFLIWVPVVAIQLFNGNYLAGILFMIWGIFISTVDNILRPVLQKSMGNIHPLVSLIGVFMGLNIFGLMGIVIGPLLLEYALLLLDVYKDEYLQ